MSFLAIILGIVFCLVCGLLILIVLLQRGRGGGLAGAFGGAGGHSAFGSKTGDVFTWVTVGFVAVYLFLAVVLNYVWRPETYRAIGLADPPPAGSTESAPPPKTSESGEPGEENTISDQPE